MFCILHIALYICSILSFLLLPSPLTKRHGRVVNTLLHIWEVPGSDLGLETGDPHLGFRGLPQSLQPNAGIVVP
jgi:hypothetical protein